MNAETVKPGTWIWGQYGFQNRLFYVVAVVDEQVVVCCPSWLTTSNATILLSQIGGRFKVVGQSAYRRWRALIPGFVRDLIPMYPRPAGFNWR